MEHRPPWEANTSSGRLEMSRILWNPKVYYRIYKSPPPVPIDQVYAPKPISRRSILILCSHLHHGLSSVLFPSGFLTKALYAPLLSPIRATCPGLSRSSCFDHARNIWWWVLCLPVALYWLYSYLRNVSFRSRPPGHHLCSRTFPVMAAHRHVLHTVSRHIKVTSACGFWSIRNCRWALPPSSLKSSRSLVLFFTTGSFNGKWRSRPPS